MGFAAGCHVLVGSSSHDLLVLFQIQKANKHLDLCHTFKKINNKKKELYFYIYICNIVPKKYCSSSCNMSPGNH